MSRSDRSAGERARARIAAMFFIAIALVSSAVAGAASFDYIDVSSDLLSFNPGHFVFDATGAWVTGNATVRYRGDGSVAFVSPVAPFYGDAMLAETSDGGLVEVLTPLVGTPFGSLPCLATKVSANGAMQWQQYIDYNDSCTSLASDGAGTLWIASEVPATANPLLVYRIDADGSGFASIAFSSTFVAQAVAAAPTAGSYVAGFDAGTSKATIIALDANGATRWQWSDASAGVTLTEIAVDTAGNVEAVGHAADQTLAVVSVGADGTLRWNQHLAAPGADRSSGFQIAADGSSFVLASAQDNTHRVLEKIGADGTLAWQSDVPVDGIGSYSSWLDEHAGLRLAPNGDILVLADSGGDDGSTTTQLVRFDGDGNVIASTEITGQPDAVAVNVSAMTALADSSALLTTRSNFTASGLASDGSAASSGLFLQVDPTGHIVPNAFAAAQVSASSTVVDSVVADDGTTYLVSNNILGDLDDHSIGGRNTRVALSAISAAGTRLWKQEYDGYWQSAHVVADATHVCVFGNFAQYWLVAWSGGTPPAGGMPDVRIECRCHRERQRDLVVRAARAWTGARDPRRSAHARRRLGRHGLYARVGRDRQQWLRRVRHRDDDRDRRHFGAAHADDARVADRDRRGRQHAARAFRLQRSACRFARASGWHSRLEPDAAAERRCVPERRPRRWKRRDLRARFGWHAQVEGDLDNGRGALGHGSHVRLHDVDGVQHVRGQR